MIELASFNKCYSNITKNSTEENILQVNKVYENNLITHIRILFKSTYAFKDLAYVQI